MILIGSFITLYKAFSNQSNFFLHGISGIHGVFVIPVSLLRGSWLSSFLGTPSSPGQARVVPWIRGDIRPRCPSLHPGCSHVCPCCGILSPNPSELIDLWQLGTLIKESRALSARREQPWGAASARGLPGPHILFGFGVFPFAPFLCRHLGSASSPRGSLFFAGIWDRRAQPEPPFLPLISSSRVPARSRPVLTSVRMQEFAWPGGPVQTSSLSERPSQTPNCCRGCSRAGGR